MSHPHAGMQYKTGNEEEPLYRAQYEESLYGFGPVRSKLKSIFKEIISLSEEILDMYDQTRDEDFLDEVEIEMKEVNEERNREIDVIPAKISEQQIIEDQSDQISAKKDIEAKLYDTDSEVAFLARRPFSATLVIEDEDIREVLVPDSGPVCANRVIPDTAEEGLRELSEVSVINTEKNADKNQKFNSEEKHAGNTDTAQVLSEETISSPFQSSTIPSSLSFGGTSLISPQVSSPLSVESSTPLPPSSLASTPRFHSCVPLPHPRKGIGVQDSSPLPTASFCLTGVYAFASQASSKNVADNPDNPDLGFDTSGTTPDNPRKPAPDIWAYVASRG